MLMFFQASFVSVVLIFIIIVMLAIRLDTLNL